MDIYLLRHGETQANADGIVQGWMDTELNATGLQQSKQAAESFNQDVDAIISSDLKRAIQTAEPFKQKFPNIPYLQDDRLRERNFGDSNGTKINDHDWNKFWTIEGDDSILNAESLGQFNDRVQSFLDSLFGLGFKKVLIVTHSGTINRIQDLTSDNHSHTPHVNGSILHLTL